MKDNIFIIDKKGNFPLIQKYEEDFLEIKKKE